MKLPSMRSVASWESHDLYKAAYKRKGKRLFIWLLQLNLQVAVRRIAPSRNQLKDG